MSSMNATIPVGSVVLVTRATGFVTSHVIRKFLKRGYKVRGTSVATLNSSSFLISQLIMRFDEAIKGVSAIAHVARILGFDPNPNNVIPHTVARVTSILTAASKDPSVRETVREIVFTSSIVAAILSMAGKDTCVDRHTWNEVVVKVAAEREIWKFVEEKKPRYTVNVVCPSAITGQPLHQKHVEIPGNWVATIVRGDKAFLDPYFAVFFVDVQDIATLHVAAILDPENDFLRTLRELRPQKDFIADYPDPYHLPISTSQSDSIAILKKWGDQEGWKPLRDSIVETVENSFFQLQ
ncbi:aldehyde reductase [Ilyonectria destructans]|nr:aldehyde reductase [Ilyonectria destructans]